MPRPLKLDEDTKAQLIRRIDAGASTDDAAEQVGCTGRTVRREAQRDEAFGQRLGLSRLVRDQRRWLRD